MKFSFSIEGDDISELPEVLEKLNRILTTRSPKEHGIKVQDPVESIPQKIPEKKAPVSERTTGRSHISRDIPFKQMLDGKVNPVYRRVFRLCKIHNCTFTTLIEKGIVNQNGDLIQDQTKASSPCSDKHTKLSDPLTIAPGLKVRQIKKDSDRMAYGELTVIARIAGGSIIECRDATGNTHKIDARCLEPATNPQRAASCV